MMKRFITVTETPLKKGDETPEPSHPSNPDRRPPLLNIIDRQR
jgi:hypothetical protein